MNIKKRKHVPKKVKTQQGYINKHIEEIKKQYGIVKEVKAQQDYITSSDITTDDQSFDIIDEELKEIEEIEEDNNILNFFTKATSIDNNKNYKYITLDNQHYYTYKDIVTHNNNNEMKENKNVKKFEKENVDKLFEILPEEERINIDSIYNAKEFKDIGIDQNEFLILILKYHNYTLRLEEYILEKIESVSKQIEIPYEIINLIGHPSNNKEVYSGYALEVLISSYILNVFKEKEVIKNYIISNYDGKIIDKYIKRLISLGRLVKGDYSDYF